MTALLILRRLRQMKKLVALTRAVILALTIALTLAACGGNDTTPVATLVPTPEVTPELTPETTPEATPEPTPEPEPEPLIGKFPFDFTTEDIYGNAVTEEALGEKEYFLVYVWNTMPFSDCFDGLFFLQGFANRFGNRVGILTLSIDIGNIFDAASTLDTLNFDIPSAIHIDAENNEAASLLAMSGYESYEQLPIILLIDGEGNIIENVSGGDLLYNFNTIEDALN